MTTNVTVFAVDGEVAIYFEDGTQTLIGAGQEEHFQISSDSFCTISDAPQETTGEEEGEHPPPGYILIDKMLEFWNRMKDRWQEATQEPEIEPHK